MPLTGAVIHDALASVGAVGGQIMSFDALAAGATGALLTAPGLTVAGAAGFLATLAEEGASFRTTREYGSTLPYDPWRGATFIQLTHESAWAGFGAWLHDRGLVTDPAIFTKNRTAIFDPRWAFLGGVYYMQAHNLWRYANAGNMLALSQAVNGGDGAVGRRNRDGTPWLPNGWSVRQRLYDAFLRQGAALLPAPAAPPRPRILPGLEYLMEPVTVAPWTDANGTVVRSGRVKRTITIGSKNRWNLAGYIDLQAGGPADARIDATVYPLGDIGGSGQKWTGTAVNDDADHGTRAVCELPDATTCVLIDWTVSGSPGAYGLITPEVGPR